MLHLKNNFKFLDKKLLCNSLIMKEYANLSLDLNMELRYLLVDEK